MNANEVMNDVYQSLTPEYIWSLVEDDEFFRCGEWAVSVEDEDKIVASNRITLVDFFYNYRYTRDNKSPYRNFLYTLYEGVTKSIYREYEDSGSTEAFDDWFLDQYELADFYIFPAIVLTFDGSGCTVTTHVWVENYNTLFGYKSMDYGYDYQNSVYYTDYYNDYSDTSIIQACLDLFDRAMFDLMYTV